MSPVAVAEADPPRRAPLENVEAQPRTARPGPFPAWRLASIMAALWGVVALSVRTFAPNRWYPSPLPNPDLNAMFDGWLRWDGVWYTRIATSGYAYTPGEQSPVAFFPGYPIVVRAASIVTRNPAIAAVVVAAVAGWTAFVLLRRWCLLRCPPAATAAVFVLALYPYAFYLYGAAYADALFLAVTLAAFLAVETDRYVVAGLAAAAASATRPLGVAVVLAITILAAARSRRRRQHDSEPSDPRGPRWFLAPIVGLTGIAAWSVYLWRTFGNPLLFATVQAAPGWDQPQGWNTWLKIAFVKSVRHLPASTIELAQGAKPADHEPATTVLYAVGLLLQAGLLLAVVLTVPKIWRRFGTAYGIYTIAVVALPLLGSKDLQGTGRYLLAAFPAFVLWGEGLVRWRRLRAVLAVASTIALFGAASLYARGFYLS